MDIIYEDSLQERETSITFEDHKSGDNIDRKIQEATVDPVLCPVRSEAAEVQHLLQIPGTTLDTPIYTFHDDGKL